MESKIIIKPLLKIGTLIVLMGFFFYVYEMISFEKQEETLAIPVSESIHQNFEVGDLIVRAGTGYESQLIKQLSGSEFSHIGVITQVFPQVMITHATTDDNPNQENQVIVSTLDEFVQPRLALSWAVYRIETLKKNDKNTLVESVQAEIGKPFVLNERYDFPRYCTTIIESGLPDVFKADLKWTKANIVGLKGELLYPNAFLEHDSVELIYSSH